jgi:hypothetical protein
MIILADVFDMEDRVCDLRAHTVIENNRFQMKRFPKSLVVQRHNSVYQFREQTRW